MGRGLSDLQKEILAVLPAIGRDRWECGCYYKDYHPKWGRVVDPCEWMLSGDVLAAIRREPTPSNRVALSKALGRLHERGLVGRFGPAWAQGSPYLYCRIADKGEHATECAYTRFRKAGVRGDEMMTRLLRGETTLEAEQPAIERAARQREELRKRLESAGLPLPV